MVQVGTISWRREIFKLVICLYEMRELLELTRLLLLNAEV